VKSKTIIKVLS